MPYNIFSVPEISQDKTTSLCMFGTIFAPNGLTFHLFVLGQPFIEERKMRKLGDEEMISKSDQLYKRIAESKDVEEIYALRQQLMQILPHLHGKVEDENMIVRAMFENAMELVKLNPDDPSATVLAFMLFPEHDLPRPVDPIASSKEQEAELFFGKGEFEKARVRYEEAAKAESSCAITHMHIGETYLFSGNPHEAEIHFKKADQLCPENPRVLQCLGAARLEQEKYDEAIDFCLRAMAINPLYRTPVTRLKSFLPRLKKNMRQFPIQEMASVDDGSVQVVPGEMLGSKKFEAMWVIWALALQVAQEGELVSKLIAESAFPEIADMERWHPRQLSYQFLVKMWDRDSFEDPNLKNADLDLLSQISAAGYLDAYLMKFFPFDVEPDEYRAWRELQPEKMLAFLREFLIVEMDGAELADSAREISQPSRKKGFISRLFAKA
jgi:tetratricopeptide (TPR) repeat protein